MIFLQAWSDVNVPQMKNDSPVRGGNIEAIAAVGCGNEMIIVALNASSQHETSLVSKQDDSIVVFMMLKSEDIFYMLSCGLPRCSSSGVISRFTLQSFSAWIKLDLNREN